MQILGLSLIALFLSGCLHCDPEEELQDRGVYTLNFQDALQGASYPFHLKLGQVLEATVEVNRFDGPKCKILYLGLHREDTPVYTYRTALQMSEAVGQRHTLRWIITKEASYIVQLDNDEDTSCGGSAMVMLRLKK